VPSTRVNTNALYLLGIAMAVSVVLALPTESALHNFGGTYWNEHSCGTAVTLLNRGLIVQAILTPLFVFLLPGAGSIIASRINRPVSVRPSNGGEPREIVVTTVIALVLLIVCPVMLLSALFPMTHLSSSWTLASATFILLMSVKAAAGVAGIVAAIYLLRAHMIGPPAAFFAAGWLFAAAVPIAWWHGLKYYAGQHGLCEMLFDRSRVIDPIRIDDLNDSYHYFVYLSVFTTMWVGTAAAGLRLKSARDAEPGSTGTDLRAFRDFFWVYVLGWAVQYRVSLWSAQPNINLDQEWLTRAFVTFIYLTASSLWTLAFIRWFWKWRVRAWWASVSVAFAGTYVIHILTMLSFFWFLLWAPAALLPLLHWNVWGMLWALTVGTWRWQALRPPRPVLAAASGRAPRQQSSAVTALTQSGCQEQPVALAGLKAVQIVAVGIFIFLLLALLCAAVFAMYIVHHRPPQYP